MICPLVILGKAAEAADLALRRILRFKECPGPLLVLDWIGRGAPLLHRDNEGRLSKRPVTWCDLANRQRPAGLFGLQPSERLHALLTGFLGSLRELTRGPMRDEALTWTADVAVRLADEGVVGLAAWHQALRRPEVRRWFPAVKLAADERDGVARMLAWALRFPGVYAVSESPNRVALPVLAGRPQTTWIEIPVEHFEPLEHTLVVRLVEIALWDAVWRSGTAADPKRPETLPTILQLFPGPPAPGRVERLKATAGWARHVAVFALSQERPVSPALGAWIDVGADLWVLGAHDLAVAPLAPWFDEAERSRVASLGAGDLWARSGATRRAVVVKVRRAVPAIPAPVALQALRGAAAAGRSGRPDVDRGRARRPADGQPL